MSEITPYLKKQTIFLTGVTGFLGKVLLHKVLQEAGEDVKVYVLIRGLKDAPAKTRLDQIFSTVIFENLFSVNPRLRDRVHLVDGDITKDRLGISAEMYQELTEEVTTIIHSAATTKFNEHLKMAMEMNVLGAKRALDLGKACKKLVSYVHISTAYVAADKPGQECHEKIYPIRVNPYEVLERVSKMSWEEAETSTMEVVSPYPNTYSFTKSLAEHIIQREVGQMPLTILRPAIVTASLAEPLPGWVDVMLGPAGLFLACGMGALRVMQGSSDIIADFVPCDIVCNAILVSAWSNTQPDTRDSGIPIYHISSSTRNPITWKWPRHMLAGYFRRFRPKRGFGYPAAFFCQNRALFLTCHFFLHVVPAGVVDICRALRGKKMFMMKASQRIHKAVTSLNYFTNRNWYFSNYNTDRLLSRMNDVDSKIYNSDVRTYDWDVYFLTMFHGMRRYLLKEEDLEHGISTYEKPISAKELIARQESAKIGILETITRNLRSYLSIISLAFMLYFFRQHFWLFQLRFKQLGRGVFKSVRNMITAS